MFQSVLLQARLFQAHHNLSATGSISHRQDMHEGKLLAYVIVGRQPEAVIITGVIDDLSHMSGKVWRTDDLVAILRAPDTILDVKLGEHAGSDQLSVCRVQAA